MRRSTRKNIRKGLRAGLIVREGRDEKDVDTFRSLLEALCRRKGILPTPPQPDFFQHLWRVFSRHGILNIFLAEFGQRAIAGHLAFPFGDTVRIWKVGWDGSMPRHYPNELLHWRTIEWAKENGFHNLDLVGANRRWAEAVLRNDPPPERAEFSETQFKAGFGGRTLFVPEACCKFGNPLVSIMVMAFGKRFLTSAVAKRFSGI